jgi:hypothetical protein
MGFDWQGALGSASRLPKGSELATPNSDLLTPNSALRTPNSELRTPHSLIT